MAPLFGRRSPQQPDRPVVRVAIISPLDHPEGDEEASAAHYDLAATARTIASPDDWLDSLDRIANRGWFSQTADGWEHGALCMTVGLERVYRELVMINVPAFCIHLVPNVLLALAGMIVEGGRMPEPQELLTFEPEEDGWRATFCLIEQPPGVSSNPSPLPTMLVVPVF